MSARYEFNTCADLRQKQEPDIVPVYEVVGSRLHTMPPVPNPKFPGAISKLRKIVREYIIRESQKKLSIQLTMIHIKAKSR